MVTLTHSDRYTALSNMPIQYTHTSNGERTTQFKSSIKMSTYILAWLISEFTSMEHGGSSHPLIRGWAQEDRLEEHSEVPDICF